MTNQPTDLELSDIKETIRHLDISPEDFEKNIIEGWEKEYDNHLDITNFPMFIWDRFNEPIKYLHKLKK